MHGRKKSDRPPTKDEKDALQAKISNYKKVVDAIRYKRKCGHLDGEYKRLLGKLLRLHPDFYSMWNYRKEVVLQELERIVDAQDKTEEALRDLFREELSLSVDCIKRNPKSYSAWHHHKWALEKGLDSLGGTLALREELALCAQFLELDGRNFHCWAYRMWVAQVMGLSVEEDFDFTTAKIKQNFSNYSAFHFRSKLLPRMVDEASRDRWQLLADELELTHDAMFTEPADQSVWWYHQFLLTWAGEGATGRDTERYEDILRTEASTLKELIEVEGRCKWAELALLLVTQRLANSLNGATAASPSSSSLSQPGSGARGQGGGSIEAVELLKTCIDMASRLAELDPMHAKFYEFVKRGDSVWDLGQQSL
ncbi:unnamed protein product [Ascophyllum nodosum]